MDNPRESIFISALRSFLKTLFGFIGIMAGVILILVIISLISVSEKEISLDYSQEIISDANGNLKELSSTTPAILQLEIHGVIGLDTLTSHAVRTQLVESRFGKLKDNRVKGIFLSMNTPGGTVIDADGIYHALKEYKEKYKVPIYVYVDGMCASGGMYVASAADKIFASNASLVGSIGVIVPTFMNFSQILEKFGIQTVTLSAGIGKDEMNPLRPWKPGEENNYRHLVDYYYQQFVNIVTSNRPQIDKVKLVDEYGAKVFAATEAQAYGLVDNGNSSRNEALRSFVSDLGLEGKEYQVIKLESKNWLSNLFKSDNPLFTGKINHQIQVGDIQPELLNKFLYLYVL